MRLLREKKRLLLSVAVLAAGVLVLRQCRSSEKEILLAYLQDAITSAQVLRRETPFEQAAIARKLASYFAADAVFEFESAGYKNVRIRKTQDLQQKIQQGRAALKSLELSLNHPMISINGADAQIEFSGSALGALREAEGQFFEKRRLRLSLQKKEGRWLVLRVEHVKNERE